MNIKPLDKEFNTNGYKYELMMSDRLLSISGNNTNKTIALYKHDNGYEVMLCTLSKFRPGGCGGMMNMRTRPPTHYWRRPNNEEFGMLGWFYTSLDTAMEKYEEFI